MPATGHSPWRRGLLELPVLALIALVVAFVLKTFVAQAFYIPSGSMEPQLHVGDRVIVSKLAYRLHEPRRGDIIVFPSPEDTTVDDSPLPVRVVRGIFEGVGITKPTEEILIKRVVGLPGETVEGRGGHVYIDGRLLIEPYLPPGVTTDAFGPTTIPKGDLWVMGDNRGDSRDSRFIGPITESSVIGRAIAKVWPAGSTSFL
ncbi:MAG: signal peptidase [Acidimicrobiaceae bacterium]